jgi:ABC-type nitrate/sulfonate/bicarbonate transport system ATPase subunit
VFDAFQIKIKTGEIVSLLGPSGCGKSTLIKLIASYLHPESGEIVSADRRFSQPDKSRIVLHQEDDLFPWMTVREQLRIGKPSMADSEIYAWLEHIGLAKRINDRTSTLSGGMKKRLSLARALVASPDILLMDESFSGLDIQTKRDLLPWVVRTIREQKQTALFATHDLDDALSLGDRIVILQGCPARIVFDEIIPPRSGFILLKERIHQIFTDVEQ